MQVPSFTQRIFAAALCAALTGSPLTAGQRQDAAEAKAKTWASCVITTAEAWSKSTEGAELVVKAAFGECASAESEYGVAIARVFNDPLRIAGETVDEATLALRKEQFRRTLGETALAAVMKARMAR